MAHKKEKTFLGVVMGLLGRIVSLVLMVCVIMLNLFMWRNLYFPKSHVKGEVAQEEVVQKKLNVEDERVRVMEARQHFHNVDSTISVESRQPPLCLRCHGNYPHTKSATIRSLCNMHTYFLACEVCHIRQKQGEVFSYRWFDNETGEIRLNIQGRKGNYGAKIIARVLNEKTGKYRRLDKPLNEEFALDFIQNKDSYTMDQQAKAKAKIHEDLSPEPILCNECHNPAMPILNFDDLEYPPQRAQQLRGTEVAGMVSKYVEFYFPTMFDADMMRKQKQKQLGAPKRISYED